MAAKTINHGLKFAVTFTNAVSPVMCEMSFAAVDPTDNIFSDPTAFTSKVWDAVVANLVPHVTAQVIFNGVVYEDIRSIPYGGADFPQTPTAGTIASTGHDLPTATCFSVKRLTGTVGRSYRGRLYWPVWDQGLLDSPDTWDAPHAQEAADALAAFQTDVEAGPLSCTLVVPSFYSDKVLRDPGIGTPITGWAYTDLAIDNQRRRLLGRGR